jgi:ribosomal protein S18 acetylase RimI-like enzyme
MTSKTFDPHPEVITHIGPTSTLPLSSADFGLSEAELQLRRLDTGDLAAVERHLLKLGPADRTARFLHGVGDAGIRAHARRLDPSRAILIGAFSLSSRIVGVAEAQPTEVPGTAEVAVSVDEAYRRLGLGRRLVVRLLALAFAGGAQSAEFIFDPSNRALVRLVRGLGGRFGTLGHASISRAAA